MLVELKIKNFAIIKNVRIELTQGLNVISGETGSGKSILMKAIGALMGMRLSADMVRGGEKTAVIEGAFDLEKRPEVIERLEELGLSDENHFLIVRRTLNNKGKTQVYLNDALVTMNTLKQIVCPLVEVASQSIPLIEFTSQHESQNLYSRSYHMMVLDQYSGCMDLRRNYEISYRRLQQIDQLILDLREKIEHQQENSDYLKRQLEEINRLGLLPGEEESLEKTIKEFKNSKKLQDLMEQLQAELYEKDRSVLSIVHRYVGELDELSSIFQSVGPIHQSLDQAKTFLDDVVFEARNLAEKYDQNESKLDELEESLSLLRKLQKKYGHSLVQIFEARDKMEKELLTIESSEHSLQELFVEKKERKAMLNDLSEQLHKRRFSGAELLTVGVNKELDDLNMRGVCFKVEVDRLSELGLFGADEVEFQISTGNNEVFRSISKVASGGEMSRLLLSLKRVVGMSSFPRTYLFDEVDSGVSGPTAEKVGRKLKSISTGQQVICITHLPQVASYGVTHFRIDKKISKKEMLVDVVKLDKPQRVDEIARLMSGKEITTTSRAHAEQLLTETSM